MCVSNSACWSSRGLMLLVLLAYSVLLLYLSNANYRCKWWSRMLSLFSPVIVMIIPGFGLVGGLTGRRTCQVLSKVTVLTVLAWELACAETFISALRDARYSDTICWAAYILIDRIIIQHYYQKVNVMLLNKLSAEVSIKSSFVRCHSNDGTF